MLHCPDCNKCKIKKNGCTHYGIQNYKCKICNRQFVEHNTHTIGSEKRYRIKKALKERVSLR
ncbi:MAG: IS1 family transposase, partial [Flammeovirgaceae bacterium]|nr:IS1 family transposase [Flammeovirgaceae bacterium]